MRRPSAAFVEWPIEELELTVRTHNCLKREGIDTVGQLAAMTEEDLAEIRNLGTRSTGEIRSALREHGREWRYEA